MRRDILSVCDDLLSKSSVNVPDRNEAKPGYAIPRDITRWRPIGRHGRLAVEPISVSTIAGKPIYMYLTLDEILSCFEHSEMLGEGGQGSVWFISHHPKDMVNMHNFDALSVKEAEVSVKVDPAVPFEQFIDQWMFDVATHHAKYVDAQKQLGFGGSFIKSYNILFNEISLSESLIDENGRLHPKILLVNEYIDGVDLADMKKIYPDEADIAPRLSPSQSFDYVPGVISLGIAYFIAVAFQELHQFNLVNRDIKPWNMMFDKKHGRFVIIDALSICVPQYCRGGIHTQSYLPPEFKGMYPPSHMRTKEVYMSLDSYAAKLSILKMMEIIVKTHYKNTGVNVKNNTLIQSLASSVHNEMVFDRYYSKGRLSSLISALTPLIKGLYTNSTVGN